MHIYIYALREGPTRLSQQQQQKFNSVGSLYIV
jgi:hypothetical protein